VGVAELIRFRTLVGHAVVVLIQGVDMLADFGDKVQLGFHRSFGLTNIEQ